jgi:hypothetical protein
VLRLAYRGDDAVPDETVLADAAALTGLPGLALAARQDVVWTDTAPPLAPETLAIRRALPGAALPAGLALAGSWVGGTGLASVVATADRAASWEGADHRSGTS